MPQENEKNKKPDVVSSIFERDRAKKVSSLFTNKDSAPLSSRPTYKSSAISSNFRKKLPAGIDIGTDSVKAVRLGYDLEGALRVSDVVIRQIPREGQDSGKSRGIIISDIIRSISKELSLQDGSFVSMPPHLDKVSLMTLPEMPQNEIDKAVRWELKQTSGGDLSDIVLDYITLENQGPRFLGKQTGVLTVTCPKKSVFEYMAQLESYGVKASAIDIEDLSDLAALDHAGKISSKEVVLFLDFGAGKTRLSIISDRELVSVRPIAVTGDIITKAISEYCSVSWQKAEEIKKASGIGQDTAVQVRNAMLPLLENMAQDIEHTFKYFSFQIAKSQITHFDRIVLSGGSSCMTGFASFLSQRLKVDADIVDTLRVFGYTHPSNAEGVAFADPIVNVAIGLALRGAS